MQEDREKTSSAGAPVTATGTHGLKTQGAPEAREVRALTKTGRRYPLTQVCRVYRVPRSGRAHRISPGTAERQAGAEDAGVRGGWRPNGPGIGRAGGVVLVVRSAGCDYMYLVVCLGGSSRTVGPRP